MARVIRAHFGLAAALGRSVGGGKAKAAGGEFERELEVTHAGIRGVALQRGNVGSVRTRGGEWRVTGKSGVDFVGVINGRAVAVDAKSQADGASFSLKTKRGTEKAEAEFLLAFHRAGGFAAFLIRDVALARVYCVSGERTLEALIAGGTMALRQPIVKGWDRSAEPIVRCLQLDPKAEAAWRRLGTVSWDWTGFILNRQGL